MQQKPGSPREQQDPNGPSGEGAPYVVFPTLNTYPWPSLGQSVSQRDAIAAMALGNAQILARYLRECSEQPHYRVVIREIADLLDPASAFKNDNPSSAAILGDLMLGGFRIDWELRFVRPRRGKPKLRA